MAGRNRNGVAQSVLSLVFHVLILTFVSGPAEGYIRKPLWNFSTGVSESDSQKKQELFEMASAGQVVLGYGPARRHMMGRIDLLETDDGYAIKDVYCQKLYTNSSFKGQKSVGPDQIPDTAILNTEHTWPQSRFTGRFPKEMQKSDLHHLYPSDSVMNSLRGNHKFAEVQEPVLDSKCAASRMARTDRGHRFEPPLEHRGNVARSLFYFSIRYQTPIDEDEESTLRKWNNDDPVDADERERHEKIFLVQRNRNPFIDHPELVEEIENF